MGVLYLKQYTCVSEDMHPYISKAWLQKATDNYVLGGASGPPYSLYYILQPS